MLKSVFAGVSGMKAHQTRIDVISDNIANVNTIGFKRSRVTFRDQFSQLLRVADTSEEGGRGGSNPKQIGQGALIATIDVIHRQGNLESTGKVTDMAIEGDGFFMLSDGVNNTFTRAGNFDLDASGYIVNPDNGMHLVGYQSVQKVDSAGEPYYEIDRAAPLQDMKVPVDRLFPPRRTTEVTFNGNLDERTTNTAPPVGDPAAESNYVESSVDVIDSVGNKHFVTLRFTHKGAVQVDKRDAEGNVIKDGGGNPVKTWEKEWEWEVVGNDTYNAPPVIGDWNQEFSVYNDTNGDKGSDSSDTPKLIKKNNTIRFDDRGVLAKRYDKDNKVIPTGTVKLQWKLPSGQIVDTAITPNFGKPGEAVGLTQFSSESTAVATGQNGYQQGSLVDLGINREGVAIGSFSNGFRMPLGQVAIATFPNAAGLQKAGETAYITTRNSGDAVVRPPGLGDSGLIRSGNLEQSNVDLTDQFSDMITTQRGFQANSRVITTSDEILQELISLKR